MNDSRLNLPSASSASADEKCPGRHLLHTQFPSEDSEYSSYGQKIHAAMKGEQVELEPDQLNWIRRASEIEDRVICNWAATSGENIKEHRELRLWAQNDDERITNSGQADVFWVEKDRALLSDYKSLFGDVPDVAENLQLRDLAVLIHLNYGVTEVTAYINQPRVTRNPKLVVYGLEDLKRAEVEMRERVKASMDPNSPRVPGVEQCKYCNGKLVCEEFKASALGTLAVAEAQPKSHQNKLAKRAVQEHLQRCSSENLVIYRERLSLAKMMKDAVDAEVKKRLEEDATSVPGLTLAEGNKVRSISDIMKAWELISGRTDKIGPDQFSACCSISIGKIEDTVKTALDCTADEGNAWVNETLGPIITLKANAASIERVKE